MNAKFIALAAAFWIVLVGVFLAATGFQPTSIASWIAIVVFGPPAYLLFEGAGELAMTRLSSYSKQRQLGSGSAGRVLLLVAVVLILVTLGGLAVYVSTSPP